MGLGLLAAFGAALCYGVGAVFQAMAARSTETVEGLDPRLIVRLLGSWRYVLGLGLDGLGFLLSLVAVRSLPLFVVESVVASFLAITAVLGAIFLGMPLTRLDRIGLVVVITGLVLVGLSAAEDSAVAVSSTEQWVLFGLTVALALAAVPLGRLPGPAGATALGAVAGLGYAVTAIATRMLPDDLGSLPTSPALWSLVIGGVLAIFAYTLALQRGSVTQATAPLVVGETVVPALVGLLLLGDQARTGWGAVALIGFTLSVAGAVSLARHGEVAPEPR